MKFVCTKENVEKALSLVSPLAGKQGNLPILQNVHMVAEDSGVKLVTTNLEVAITISIRAKVEIPGSFTVPAKTLSEFVRLLPEEQITFSHEGNELHIQSGSSGTKIKGEPADDYPVIPPVEGEHTYTLAAGALREALTRAAVAVARNEMRPELSGVSCQFFPEFFSGLVLAATDSYRLAESRVEVLQGTDETKCILPMAAVQEMSRTLAGSKTGDAAQLWVTDNQVSLKTGDIELSSRLIQGNYPDYRQIIPDSFATEAKIPKQEFVQKIKAASLFTASGTQAVSLDLQQETGVVTVSSTSSQTGEHSASVDIEVTGEENSVVLNHKYVLDGLAQISTDTIHFRMNSSNAPCLLSPEGSDRYFYVVMPIRQ